MTAQRQIPEDFSKAFRRMLPATAVIVLIILAGGFAGGDWMVARLSLGVAVLATIASVAMLRSARRRLAVRGIWQSADEGLQRVYAGGECDTILWRELVEMHWSEGRGLILRWMNTGPRGEDFENEFGARYVDGQGRAVLYVDEKEAADLVSIWKKKNAVATDQPHVHARRARPNQRARSVIGFMAILAAILCLWGTVSIALQYPSCKWPSTEGKIISQYYREFPYDLRHRVAKAQLEIHYAYTVAGITYESDRFSLWQSIYQDPNDVIRAFADQHRKGTPITVYYKPGNPKKAVLQTGPNWRGDFALMLGGAFLAWVAFLMKLLVARAAQAKARAVQAGRHH